MKRLLATAGLFVCACDEPAAGQGTLRITAWGEGFIEQGIPAETFVDGWSVTFDAFLVSVEAVEAEGNSLPGTYVLDLAQPSGGAGHELGLLTVSAGRPARLSWSVSAAVEDAVTDVEDDVLETMVGAGAAVWARGVAIRGTETKTFDWALDIPSRYTDCQVEGPSKGGETSDAVLTVHADHLFYDDLDSQDPHVAFGLIAAADSDGDGAVTLAELKAQSLSGQARYQVGGREIDNLYGFVLAQAGTVGHINGEGHCATE
ncbi:MAG: hypothetical protein KUG77_01115 [Nannocystaceae bacterium]|nr:hypothetical protein [Nannocystaceae bacterium]